MTVSDIRIDARDWALLACLSVLWGGSFFFNGVVLRELPPFTLVLLRVLLAAMILLPLLYAQGSAVSGGVGRTGNRFSSSRSSTMCCRSR